MDNFCRLFSINQRPICFHQTPGRRPPRHITGRRGNIVTLDERARFRFHDAIVFFVDRCLARTRNLAAGLDFTTQSFFSSIDVWRELEISPPV